MELLTSRALEKEIDEIMHDFEKVYDNNCSSTRVKNLVKFALLKMYDSCQVSFNLFFEHYNENIEKELQGQIIKEILTNSIKQINY